MSSFLRSAFLPLALLFTSVSLHAQTLSPSKLSAHLINAYTSASSNIVAGYPRTLKVLGLDSGFPAGILLSSRPRLSAQV